MEPSEIKKALTPTHLIDEPTKTLKEEFEQFEDDIETTSVTEEVEKAKEDLRLEKEFRFNFSYTNKRGKTFQGEFLNKILTIQDKIRVGAHRSKLIGGLPLSSLDNTTAEITFVISHLLVSLIESPEWANDLGALDDVNLLFEIYTEVSLHENTFHGGD